VGWKDGLMAVVDGHIADWLADQVALGYANMTAAQIEAIAKLT
jgi:hypothetical protein